eukprot:Sspe_Gene.91674::Locus_63248_Transcript_1_1_Confidence_1.000_Length_2618::g.91674::m.91674
MSTVLPSLGEGAVVGGRAGRHVPQTSLYSSLRAQTKGSCTPQPTLQDLQRAAPWSPPIPASTAPLCPDALVGSQGKGIKCTASTPPRLKLQRGLPTVPRKEGPPLKDDSPTVPRMPSAASPELPSIRLATSEELQAVTSHPTSPPPSCGAYPEQLGESDGARVLKQYSPFRLQSRGRKQLLNFTFEVVTSKGLYTVEVRNAIPHTHRIAELSASAEEASNIPTPYQIFIGPLPNLRPTHTFRNAMLDEGCVLRLYDSRVVGAPLVAVAIVVAVVVVDATSDSLTEADEEIQSPAEVDEPVPAIRVDVPTSPLPPPPAVEEPIQPVVLVETQEVVQEVQQPSPVLIDSVPHIRSGTPSVASRSDDPSPTPSVRSPSLSNKSSLRRHHSYQWFIEDILRHGSMHDLYGRTMSLSMDGSDIESEGDNRLLSPVWSEGWRSSLADDFTASSDTPSEDEKDDSQSQAACTPGEGVGSAAEPPSPSTVPYDNSLSQTIHMDTLSDVGQTEKLGSPDSPASEGLNDSLVLNVRKRLDLNPRMPRPPSLASISSGFYDDLPVLPKSPTRHVRIKIPEERQMEPTASAHLTVPEQQLQSPLCEPGDDSGSRSWVALKPSDLSKELPKRRRSRAVKRDKVNSWGRLTKLSAEHSMSMEVMGEDTKLFYSFSYSDDPRYVRYLKAREHGTAHCVIICISKYEFNTLSASHADDDAIRLKRLFQTLGYTTDVISEAAPYPWLKPTQENITQALKVARDSSLEDGILIVVWEGRGVYGPPPGKQDGLSKYLLYSDSRNDADRFSLGMVDRLVNTTDRSDGVGGLSVTPQKYIEGYVSVWV